MLERPPRAEEREPAGLEEVPQRDDSQVLELQAEVAHLRREVDLGKHQRKALASRTKASLRGVKHWESTLRTLRARLAALEQARPIAVDQWQRLQRELEGLREEDRWLGRRMARLEGEGGEDLAEVSEELAGVRREVKRLRSAVSALSVPVGALVAARSRQGGWDDLLTSVQDAFAEASAPNAASDDGESADAFGGARRRSPGGRDLRRVPIGPGDG